MIKTYAKRTILLRDLKFGWAIIIILLEP